MKELRYTLLTDGPSDKAIVSILNWLLKQYLPRVPIQSRWSDLRRLYRPPRELHKRIQKSAELYPCDLLFVHRDAETVPLNDRLGEVVNAFNMANSAGGIPPVVSVIPVRMMEAWLLFDVNAIRLAAGNPNGVVELNMPKMCDIESLPNPKGALHTLLREATEWGSHRKDRFDTGTAAQRIPEYISDFSPLRSLSAFKSLENRILEIIRQQNWTS